MKALDPRLERSLFIAGTDTGVGKTWVATRLLRAWVRAGQRAAGMKPVAAGATRTGQGWRNEDALALLAAGNVDLPYELLNPVCLPRAASPHLAARDAHFSIDIESIKADFDTIVSKSDVIVVEGAGGWYAPIREAGPTDAGRGTMAELARLLDLPVLLVVGLRLGCLNHALLTTEAIARCGCKMAGWIANPVDSHFTDQAACIEWLEGALPAPRLAVPEY